MYKPAEMATVIKELSKERGITVKQVLAECLINKGFIYDLEHKGAYPSVDKIVKLAEYFGVSTDYLLKCESSQ